MAQVGIEPDLPFGQALAEAGIGRLLLCLSGNPSAASLIGEFESTPWDANLEAAMIRAGVAVHEESVVDALAADLDQTPGG